MIIKIYI